MAMDRILERLESGQPLRVGQVAELVGYSVRYVQKLIEQGELGYVQREPGAERRVPVQEAKRLAADLGVPVRSDVTR